MLTHRQEERKLDIKIKFKITIITFDDRQLYCNDKRILKKITVLIEWWIQSTLGRPVSEASGNY